MTTNENEQPAAGPEKGATEEAVALHGDQARAETHPQPETVTLPGDTRIAVGDTDEDDDE